MITFAELVMTKNGLEKVSELNKRIEKVPNATRITNHINCLSMQTINKLLGKYFNAPKKVVLKQISEKSKGYYGNGDRIEFSKAGIGFVNSYSKNNTPYRYFIVEKNSFVNMILKDDFVFEAAKKCMSEEGGKILDGVKEVYDNNKIVNLQNKQYGYDISFSVDEMNIFNLKDTNGIITLEDKYERLNISVFQKSEFKKDYWGRKEICNLDNISDFKNTTNLIYGIFTNNHIEDFNKLIDNYENITTPQIESWKKFDAELKQKLAKYLLLEKI